LNAHGRRWFFKALAPACTAAGFLIALAVLPQPPLDGGESPFPARPVSRVMSVMKDMDAISTDLGRMLRDEASFDLTLPMIATHSMTLTSLAKKAREMTEGADRTHHTAQEWHAMSDAMIEACDALASRASEPAPDRARLREAESALGRRCVECHNVFVP
jgi:cytochrome c556